MQVRNPRQSRWSGASHAMARWWGVVLLFVMVASVVFVLTKNRGRSSGPTDSTPVEGQQKTAGAQREPTAPATFERLAGRWVRPDGGYVLEIKKTAADGSLAAAYYNPQPIHVSRARAVRLGSLVKVEVELRDTGYPGCLYTLLYDEGRDVLRGTYYQAALGETYEIQFERIKE